MKPGEFQRRMRDLAATFAAGAEKCPRCGKPKEGLQLRQPGGRLAHGFQSRDQAGLCICPADVDDLPAEG